ncbi:ATP-binding protein [Streptomyces violens]|uniref:ATP-binding protein n=1 Tax=Streptomyces violens TaxID=66377 RepID=UPI0007C8171B|nr:NB-ARC domain-containing protein [Streptomyces violens]
MGAIVGGPRGNVPPEPTEFVGRRTELAVLKRLLAGSRLTTLTGVGGVGKTRLARQACETAGADYPDGIWLVELGDLQQPELVYGVVAEALPLADQTTRPLHEVLCEWLADRRLLLLFDGCEQLLPPCAQAVEVLLAAAPGVRILATSRQRLTIRGERLLRVPPLPLPPLPTDAAVGGPEEPCEAVALFVRRAAAAVPGFALTERNRADVEEICRRLDGIPLALELAAARLTDLPVPELLGRLQSRFEVLADDSASLSRPKSPRHRTLRTTIGWSHELCTSPERLAWARLSVFVGGFEQEAAEWVCAGKPLRAGGVAGVLSALVNKSILQQAGTTRGPRYSMLDTVREYGQEWLARLGEQTRLQERHRDYYRYLARAGEREWFGPDQVAWSERLTAEHANLRGALERCLDRPDPRTALEMSGNLWFFWFGCGFLREGNHYLDRALGKKPDSGTGPARFWALLARGLVALGQGDFEAVAALHGICTSMAEQLGDPAAAAAALYLKGTHPTMTGRPAHAIALLEEANRSPDCGGGSLAARFLIRCSMWFAHLQLGQFDQAETTATTLHQETEERDEQWMRGYALYFLSTAALANDDPATAVRHARISLKIKWRLHDTLGAALVLDALAPAVAAIDPERAARLLGIADTLWRSFGLTQMGTPGLIATRQACAQRIREAIGDASYEQAYKAGLATRPEDCVAHALSIATHDSSHRCSE